MKKVSSIKENLIAAIICLGLIATGALWGIRGFAPTADAAANVGPTVQGTQYFITAASGVNRQAGSIVATTSKVFLTTADTASSTIAGVLKRGSQIDLDLRAIASTSASVLNLAIETSDNGVDFYPLEEATTTSQNPLMMSNGAIAHTWNLSTTSGAVSCGTNEICKHVSFSNLSGTLFRVRIWVTGANAAAWAKASVPEVPLR